MFNRRKPEDAKPVDVAASHSQSDFLIPPVPGADKPADSGLDMPVYRPTPPDFSQLSPALPKETQMARSPFAPTMPPAPTTVMRPSAGLPSPRENNAPEAGEPRTLVVSRGISVQGTVQDAQRLVVEGTVEATMVNGLAEISISHGGMFKGEVEVDEAEVAGTIDGTLIARNSLIIRATGRVLGTARCRRLQVEDGGQITGRIEMLGDIPAPAPVHMPVYEPTGE